MKLIKSLFFSIIYIADDRFSFFDKLFSYIKILLAFAPIAYLYEVIIFNKALTAAEVSEINAKLLTGNHI